MSLIRSAAYTIFMLNVTINDSIMWFYSIRWKEYSIPTSIKTWM